MEIETTPNNTLTFEKYLPAEELRMYIDFYWVAKDTSKIYKYHILPNYRTYIVFILSGQAYFHDKGNKVFHNIKELIQQPLVSTKSFVVSPHIDYNIIETENHLDIIGVHFTTIGAALLNTSNNTQTINPILQNKDLINLEKNFLTAHTPQECFTLLDRYFLKQLIKKNIQINNDLINRLIQIETSTDVPNVAKLNDTMCLGERQTLRVFNNYVGVTPREYCRIKRFKTALDILTTNK